MFDYNVLAGLGVAAFLVIFIAFISPYLKKKGMKTDIYQEIKLGLMLFGYAFRDEKVKEMTNIIYGIVSSFEELDIAAREKKAEALQVAFTELMEELNITLDEEALSLIIDIAVSYLPPTHSEIE